MSLDRRVLEQDLPQYEQSTKAARERRDKEALQQYEAEQREFDRQQREAEVQQQNEIQITQEDKKQTVIDKYTKQINEIKEKRDQALKEAYDSVWGSGGSRNRSEYNTKENKISNKYESQIKALKEKQRIESGKIDFSETYPGVPISQSDLRTFRDSPSRSLVGIYQNKMEGKQARLEYQQKADVQTARNEARAIRESIANRTDNFVTGYGLQIGSERAANIKPTPNVITGKQAVESRRPLINVKTVETIYGGQQIDTNPRAFVASLTRQNVDAAGKPTNIKDGSRVVYSFQNVSDVQDPSALALLEFQSQLKTQTAPEASVYRGILEERGLKETPLAKRIIKTYSSKPVQEYKTRAEAFGLPEAEGKRGLIKDPLGATLFNLETGYGDPIIGKKFGFVYDYNLGLPIEERGKTFEGSLQYVLSPKLQGPTEPKYEIINAVPGSLEFAIKSQKAKPLSSFGERVEYGLKLIDSEQKKYAKYNDEAGQLLHVGLGFGKDVLAGAAFVENTLYQGEALIRKGETKTRDISIPPTAFGVATEEVLAGRPQLIYPKILAYEKTYGKGSTSGEVLSLLVPLPGAKIRAPSIIVQKTLKIYQKTKIPALKRFIQEKVSAFELNKNTRIVKNIAESRSDEGIYGIKKESKRIFLIERGLEEQRTQVKIPKVEPQLQGFTKEGKPIFTKKPKKENIPPVGKVANTPVTVVKFGGKEKISITDFTAPKDYPIPPKRILISSPDIEFIRQIRSLKAVEIAKGIYEIKNPSRKTLKRISEMEKEGYLSNVATGRTAPLNLVKKEKIKHVKLPKTVKEMMTQSNAKIIKSKPKFSIGISRAKTSVENTILGEKKPITVKEMRKLEKKLLKQKRKETIFDVVERPNITQVYETLGGLGKAKFVKDVTKTKDIIPFGSKDLERKLESVGLGEKRVIGKPKTPYNYSQTKQIKGIGGSTGKAKTISKSAKETIIKSSIPKLEPKKIPIDYLQVRSGYVSRNIEEPITTSGSLYTTEYVTPRYPEEKMEKLVLDIRPKNIPRIESKISVNISQLPSSMQYNGVKTQLDTSSVTKQKEETLQKQKNRLETTLTTRRALRTRRVPKVKLVATVIPDIMQSVSQPQQLKQPQRLQQKQKQIQILKYQYPQRSRGENTRRRPFVFRLKENEITKRKESKPGEKADFLGNVSETSISGIFKRSETVYGQKKINRLLKGDVRVVSGKKRATKRGPIKWKEGKKGDMFGFKNEAKKKRKFSIL